MSLANETAILKSRGNMGRQLRILIRQLGTAATGRSVLDHISPTYSDVTILENRKCHSDSDVEFIYKRHIMI